MLSSCGGVAAGISIFCSSKKKQNTDKHSPARTNSTVRFVCRSEHRSCSGMFSGCRPSARLNYRGRWDKAKDTPCIISLYTCNRHALNCITRFLSIFTQCTSDLFLSTCQIIYSVFLCVTQHRSDTVFWQKQLF